MFIFIEFFFSEGVTLLLVKMTILLFWELLELMVLKKVGLLFVFSLLFTEFFLLD